MPQRDSRAPRRYRLGQEEQGRVDHDDIGAPAAARRVSGAPTPNSPTPTRRLFRAPTALTPSGTVSPRRRRPPRRSPPLSPGAAAAAACRSRRRGAPAPRGRVVADPRHEVRQQEPGKVDAAEEHGDHEQRHGQAVPPSSSGPPRRPAGRGRQRGQPEHERAATKPSGCRGAAPGTRSDATTMSRRADRDGQGQHQLGGEQGRRVRRGGRQPAQHAAFAVGGQHGGQVFTPTMARVTTSSDGAK